MIYFPSLNFTHSVTFSNGCVDSRAFSPILALSLLPSLSHDFHEIVGEVSSGQVETQDGVRESVSFVDGDCVSDAIAGVEDDAGRSAGSVKRKHGLNGDVHRRRVEGLERDLRHLLAIRLRIRVRTN